MNHFDTLSTAERYAKGRPPFHQLVIDRISKTLDLQGKVDRALDIACGTGLSSRPLLSIAKEVDRYQNPISMTREQLILYFTTHSNIAATIDRGQSSYREVETWLDQELVPFFPPKNAIRTLRFGSWIRYLAELGN